MESMLDKEAGMGNIDLLIRRWGILTTHNFEMGNLGLNALSPLLFCETLSIKAPHDSKFNI